MNKIILLHLFIISIYVSPIICSAQDIRPLPVDNNNPAVVAPLPANTTPAAVTPLDPMLGEPKNQNAFNSGPTKRVNPKQEQTIGFEKFVTQQTTDKEGNLVQKLTREQKTLLYDEMNSQPSNNSGSQDITYPDLQVTATQEIIPASNNFGTERLPNTTSVKKINNETAQKNNSTETSTPANSNNSKIGKVEFLKQYVEELKILIEKNKNNPTYPLAEKQKELKEIEDLLKEE